MDLNELKDKAYQNAVAHGWHEKEFSDEHYLCLVMSELMEAVEADRKENYAGVEMKDLFEKNLASGEDFKTLFESRLKGTVEEELADACIRLLDFAGLKGLQLELVDINTNIKLLQKEKKMPFTEYIYHTCSLITNLYENMDERPGTYIGHCLSWIFAWCEVNNIDITWYIKQKMRYNEQREYKHGNKKY